MPDTTPTLINRTAIGANRSTGADGASQRLAAGWKHWLLTSNATELKLTVLVIAGVTLAGLLT